MNYCDLRKLIILLSEFINKYENYITYNEYEILVTCLGIVNLKIEGDWEVSDR